MRAAGATTAVAAPDAPERGASLGAARAGAPRARIAFENFGRELSGRAPQTFFSHFLNAASPTHGQLTRRARSYLLPPLSLQPRDRCTRCVARRPLGRQRGELFGEARLRHIEAVARQAGRQHRMRNGPRCGGQGRAGLRVRLRVGSGPRGQGPTLVAGCMRDTSARVVWHAAVERAKVPEQQPACRACGHDHLPHGHRVVLEPAARPRAFHRRRVPAQWAAGVLRRDGAT